MSCHWDSFRERPAIWSLSGKWVFWRPANLTVKILPKRKFLYNAGRFGIEVQCLRVFKSSSTVKEKLRPEQLNHLLQVARSGMLPWAYPAVHTDSSMLVGTHTWSSSLHLPSPQYIMMLNARLLPGERLMAPRWAELRICSQKREYGLLWIYSVR